MQTFSFVLVTLHSRDHLSESQEYTKLPNFAGPNGLEKPVKGVVKHVGM